MIFFLLNVHFDSTFSKLDTYYLRLRDSSILVLKKHHKFTVFSPPFTVALIMTSCCFRFDIFGVVRSDGSPHGFRP